MIFLNLDCSLRIMIDLSNDSKWNNVIQFATGVWELFSILQTACVYVWANSDAQSSVNDLCEFAVSGWHAVSGVSLKSEEAIIVLFALVLSFAIFLLKEVLQAFLADSELEEVLRAFLADSEKKTFFPAASTRQKQAVIAKHERNLSRASKLKKRSKKIYNELFKNIQSLNARLMKQIQKNTALLQNVEKLELENARLKKEALSFVALAEEEVKDIDASPFAIDELKAANAVVKTEPPIITKESLKLSFELFDQMEKKAAFNQSFMTRLRQKLNEDERCSNPKIWKNSQEAKKIAAQVKFLELLPLELDQFVAKVFRFRYTRCYETDEEMPGFSAKMDELCSIMPGGKEGLVTFELVSANAPFFNQMLECMFPAGNFSHVIDELREKEEIENAPQAAHEMEEQRCLNALLQFCPVGSDSEVDVKGGIEESCKRYHAKRLQENAPFDLEEFQSIIDSTIGKSWGNGGDGCITRGLLQNSDCLVEFGRMFLGEQDFVDSMTNLFPDFKEKLPLVEAACKFVNVTAGLENACDLYRVRMLIRNEPDFELDSFKSAILGSFSRILETGDLERISRDSLADKGYLENLDLLFKGQDSENPSDAFEEYMEALIPGFAEKLPDLKEAYRIEADVPGTFHFFGNVPLLTLPFTNS